MLRLTIHGDDPVAKVEKEIYGHFTEHIGGVMYDGIWVGEDSPVANVHGLRLGLIEKMKAIRAPMIRWPGGCFAETYNWRDGIGPREKRPVRVNWWMRSDGRYEPNLVGTHEFTEFCRLIGAEPYFAANITSTTPLDIRDWVDYCNSPAGTTALAKLREENGSREPFGVKYWGVGNETWGGGGNMTGEVYAHEYRKYAAVMDNTCPGLELICSGANHADWHWPCDVLSVIEPSMRLMSGLSLHFYCGSAGDPLAFSEEEWYRQLRQALDIERAIERNWGFVVGYGLERQARLVVDEWGCWHPAGSGPSFTETADTLNNPHHAPNLFEQQSTMRDAVVAAATLNIFQNHAEKVRMAAVAQLVNNLHCLFLTRGEKLIVTPTYHVYDMMKEHMEGTALRISGDRGEIARERYALPEISASATRKGGQLTVTLANLSLTEAKEVSLSFPGLTVSGEASGSLLTAGDPHDCNTFDAPDTVKTRPVSGVRPDAVTVPAYSVMTLTVDVR